MFAHIVAVRRMCSSPAAGNRNSQSMLLGTRERMRSQTAKIPWSVVVSEWRYGVHATYRVNLEKRGPSHCLFGVHNEDATDLVKLAEYVS